MDVRPFGDAKQALAEVSEPLRFAGAEGELSFGILRRLVTEPDAYGEVTIQLGTRSGSPAALVTMTGAHPALIVGFTEVEDGGFCDLVGAMLETGRRPLGVNGARRWSEPFAQAWHEIAGATPGVYRDMLAFELRTVRPPRVPAGHFRVAVLAEAGLLARSFVAFGADIRELITDEAAASRVAELISARDLAVWAVDGEVVSMAAVSRRTPWSHRSASSTRLPTSAAGALPAPSQERCPSASSTPARAGARSSPTRPIRPPTTSTPTSATSRRASSATSPSAGDREPEAEPGPRCTRGHAPGLDRPLRPTTLDGVLRSVPRVVRIVGEVAAVTLLWRVLGSDSWLVDVGFAVWIIAVAEGIRWFDQRRKRQSAEL